MHFGENSRHVTNVPLKQVGKILAQVEIKVNFFSWLHESSLWARKKSAPPSQSVYFSYDDRWCCCAKAKCAISLVEENKTQTLQTPLINTD